MTFDFTLFAALQILGGYLMAIHIRQLREDRARVSSALKSWVRDGDVYFTLGVGR